MHMLSREAPPRKYRRPVRPVRVTPHSRDFAAGLVVDDPGLSTPIDQRTLPTIDGAGLTADEHRQVNGARNRAMGEYGRSCPDASWAEVERVGRAAAADQLRIVLKGRPTAPALKAPQARGAIVQPRGCGERRMPYTTADAAWWVANSPTRHYGYDVVAKARPMTWDRWHREAAPETAEVNEPVGVLAGHADLD